MEQENSFPETPLQQNSHSQHPSYENPLNSEITDMTIENFGSEDFSNMILSQLLQACQFKKAFGLLQTEFDLKQVDLGASNIKLVRLLNQMAEVQIAMAEYSKASDLCQKSDQILRKYQNNSDFHSLMARTYQNLAIISRENKEYKEALDLINKSLALSSAQSIEKYRIKALVLCDLQLYKEALQEIQRSLEMADKSVDIIDNIERARVYNTLGEIQFTAKNWDKAKIAYETASEICKRYDLSSHIELAKACEGLGNTLIETKRISPAISRLGESALEIYDKCFGEDSHPARISSFLLLAKYYKQEKDHSKTKEYINLAVEEGEAFYGVGCEKIRDVRISAATIVAKDLYLRDSFVNPILETATKGKQGRELVNLYLQQCDACLLREDYELFEDIFPKAVETIKKRDGKMSLEMAKVYEKIATFYRKKKQRGKSIEYLERCIGIYNKIFGENYIETGHTYLMISRFYSSQNKYCQGVFCLEQALKIQTEFYGEANSLVIETSTLLAKAYEFNKELSKSMKAHFRILKIQEKIGDEMVYETYESIGMLYLKMFDPKNSGSWFRKSYQMARVKFGMKDARTLDTKEWSEFNAEDKDLLGNTQEMI